jgi:DNA-binding LacI/PurR family transcriptional regulator
MAALDPELVLGAIINKQYADICAGTVIVSHGIGFAPTKEAIGAAWDSGVRFDGLVTHNDNEAIGAMVALIERGVRIPEDVKVVGSDDLSTARDSIIPVTTIHHDIEQIGRNAVEAMSEMLGGRVPEEYPPVDNWLIRRSTT